MWIVGIALFAQIATAPVVAPVEGYLTNVAGQVALVLPDGTHELAWPDADADCQSLDPSQVVGVLYGSGDGTGNVGVMLLQGDLACSALLGDVVAQ